MLPLFEFIVGKNSLVFVPGVLRRLAVAKGLAKDGTTGFMYVGHAEDIEEVSPLWHDKKNPCAMLIQPPLLAHGVYLPAERVVWISDVGEYGKQQHAVFLQSIYRARLPYEHVNDWLRIYTLEQFDAEYMG